MIGPGLARDPLERVEAVGGVVTVNAVLTLGAVASAAILIDRGVATTHHLAPAAQQRTAHRRLGIGQPSPGAVGHVLAFG